MENLYNRNDMENVLPQNALSFTGGILMKALLSLPENGQWAVLYNIIGKISFAVRRR